MRAVAVSCLLGAAVLWAWALFWPRPDEAMLEERFVGKYRIVRYEPPPDMKGMPNPYPQGQTHQLILMRDGTFAMPVYVPADMEMTRTEGRAYVDVDGRFIIEALSRNRVKERGPKDRFRFAFLREKEGEVLHLVHEEHQFHLYLLRLPS